VQDILLTHLSDEEGEKEGQAILLEGCGQRRTFGKAEHMLSPTLLYVTTSQRVCVLPCVPATSPPSYASAEYISKKSMKKREPPVNKS
jgi:hypothetical protein